MIYALFAAGFVAISTAVMLAALTLAAVVIVAVWLGRRLAHAVRELRTAPTGHHRRVDPHPDVPPPYAPEVPPMPDTPPTSAADTQPIRIPHRSAA